LFFVPLHNMKFVTYNYKNTAQAGLLVDGNIYPVAAINTKLSLKMADLLTDWESSKAACRTIESDIKEGKYSEMATAYNEKTVLSPVPSPTSCRDGYAFRQHVASARKNRGVDMIPEFDEFPIFYFTNHNAVQGPGDIDCMPDHFEKLDFELEAAIVVGKRGRNITAAQADDYIAGYMIMNDMSARAMQMEEMKLNLGPAKGKDFSTAIGPFFITPDELEPYKVPCKPGHTGNAYNLTMTCKVNGVEVSRGNVADMDWTFAEILERCAYGTDIVPGDVIGSGTVGTGCFLELNGTAKLKDANAVPQWLQANDEVVMTIDGLGTLHNTIKAVDSSMSLFAIKKN
jgi:fumarylacetoacetate (FAA) hydrolase